jgi:hypothetical protein
MNHDVLIAIFILVTVLPLLVLMWWSSTSLQGIDWERMRKIKEARFMAKVPHAVHLWSNLLLAIQEHKSEDEIKKCMDDVREYINNMPK